MAKVHVLNVNVHNNPAPFFTPFQFEIHFECLEDLQDDLEFKIIYVSSADNYDLDQVLDQIVVDAVSKGQFKFMFQADPPDISKIPAEDAIGVTVILITATYKNQEFVRVGYYVNNDYEDPELKENPPIDPEFNKLVRTISSEQPRVTKFKINWELDTKNANNQSLNTEEQINQSSVNESNLNLNENNHNTLVGRTNESEMHFEENE